MAELSLAAIVLAGGQSSRMGCDKALIPIQGVPLLQRTCEVALACTPIVCVVTPWVERYQTVIPSRCRIVQEQLPSGETAPPGPLVGFAQGLAEVETNWVLLLACDLPRLQPQTLRNWSLQLHQATQETAWLPRSEKGWEPLCGFYRVNCLSRLRAWIALGHRSFQSWLAQECVGELQVADRSLLFNCNTPDDLSQLDA